MDVRRANLNNHPELPELRHRRMPQALTTIMQSGSMRAGGRDSRSNMKDGTGSPAAMPACTAPLRVKWLHLAAALIGIAATMVPGVGVADDVYLRAGIGFDRPAETRFMDKDCSSVSPAALYGCGKRLDLRLLVDRQHHRKSRWIEIQADDFGELLGEGREP